MQSTWLGSVGLLETPRIYIAHLEHTNQPCIHHIHPKKNMRVTPQGAHLISLPSLSFPIRACCLRHRDVLLKAIEGPLRLLVLLIKVKTTEQQAYIFASGVTTNSPSWWAELGWNLPPFCWSNWYQWIRKNAYREIWDGIRSSIQLTNLFTPNRDDCHSKKTSPMLHKVSSSTHFKLTLTLNIGPTLQ